MSLSTAAAAVFWTALQFWNPFAPPAPPAPSRAEVSQCLAAPEPMVRRVRMNAIFFCGRINDDAIALVRAELLPTDRVLLIASFGGVLDAPIYLGELVRDRALAVEVVGPCLSGCASFVFVASRHRSVGPGGVLGLHNTATSALQLARASGALTDEDRPLEVRAHREALLYASVGVDADLLLEPQVRLETLCLEVGRADARTGETRFLIHSRHSLWAPSRAQWRAHGVRFTGQAPYSAVQARRLLNEAAGTGIAAAANVTMSDLTLPAPPQVYLADVERCAPGDR